MSRGLAGASLTLAAAFLAGGCTKARTEVVLVVSTEGVRIPDDVERVRLQVSDTSDPTAPLFDKTFRICGPLVSGECLDMPLVFPMIPGKSHPESSVRVQLTALRGTMPVIDDAAIFTFTPEQSLRLDFVLYANCLGSTDCAVRDQACGPDAMCHTVTPVPLMGEPDFGVADLAANGPSDLSGGAPADLSGGDMTRPVFDLSIRDLAGGTDFAMPRDMSMCNNMCGARMCGPDPGGCGITCGSGCDATHMCDPGGVCQPCGMPSGACCLGGVCNGSDYYCNGARPVSASTAVARSRRAARRPPAPAAWPATSAPRARASTAAISASPCCGSAPACTGALTCLGTGGNMTCQSSDAQVLNWTVENFSGAAPANGTFYGVWADTMNVVAVGTLGIVYRHRPVSMPDTLDPDASNPGVTLYRVWGSPTIWAVGFGGYVGGSPASGGAWTQVSRPDSLDRTGVWARGDGAEAFVVGGKFMGVPPNQPYTLDHYYMSGWLQSMPATSMGTALNCVWSDGAGGVFMCGDDDGSYFFNTGPTMIPASQVASGVTRVQATTPHFVALRKAWGTSISNIYAVGGQELIYRYDATAGDMPPNNRFNPPERYNATGSTLNGVSGTSASDVWVVGDKGTVLHSKGAGNDWTQQGNLPPSAVMTNLQDVFAVSPNEVYVVGGDTMSGKPVVWKGHQP